MACSLQIRAVNTAADSENRIHDSRVAGLYGFEGGLVPGVTIYGYMAYAVVNHFGEEWLERGAMDVRFFLPFYDGEQVVISISDQDSGRVKVDAGARAAGTAWLSHAPPEVDDFAGQPMSERVPASRETMKPGVVLSPVDEILDLSAPGMSAPLDAWIGDQRLAQPAILLALANEILMKNFVLGPWIHSASEVRNANSVRDGDPVYVQGKIVEAYERKGHELVVLDIAIHSRQRLVSRIRHTAIWQLRQSA